MNKYILMAILLTPIWLIGWMIGYIARPFIMGFYKGLNHTLEVENHIVNQEAIKLYNSEENE